MNDDKPSYEDRLSAANASLRRAYASWQSADPATFAQAKARGVHKPKFDNTRLASVPDGNDGRRKLPVASALPAAPEDEPEEIILQALVEAGLIVPAPSRPRACTVIAAALDAVFAKRDVASASREADGMLRLLYLLGAAKDRTMALKARVCQALIARNENSLATIGKEFGVDRADVSKTARQLKAFLGLKIDGATRNEAYSEQARIRAHRVHAASAADAHRAENLRKTA